MTDREKIYLAFEEHALKDLFDKEPDMLTFATVKHIMDNGYCVWCAENSEEYKQLSIEDLGINLYEED